MPLTSTVWVSSGAAAADAAGCGAGAACCAQAGAIAPDISSAADAKGFKRKDMAASEGGYRCSGSASVRVDGMEGSLWLRSPMGQRAEQPRGVRDPLLGPAPGMRRLGFFGLAEIDVVLVVQAGRDAVADAAGRVPEPG